MKIGLDNSGPKDGDFVGGAGVPPANPATIRSKLAGRMPALPVNSNAFSLSCDDNGNLTDDGIFKFVYDAWNRMVAVKSRYTSSTTQTTFATYAYEGTNRRTKTGVQNSGVEIVANDGGNTTIHYYGDTGSHVLETRNGSSQTQRQFALARQELFFSEKQGHGGGNDVNPERHCSWGDGMPILDFSFTVTSSLE